MKFAGVIVDISHEQLDKIFQYIIPETMLPELEIGMKVQIPFGKTKRTGYVVDISDEPEIDISRMKSLTGICGHSVTIDGRMIKLANWIKNHYGSTMNQALKLVMPVKEKVRNIEKKTIHLLISKEEAEEYAKEAARKRYTARARLLETLAKTPVVDYSLLTQKLNINLTTVKTLENKGIIEITTHTMFRNTIKNTIKSGEKILLNEEQRYVAESIIKDMENGEMMPSLIKGVTGSGKTEVYLELIEWVINRGGDVICLIPEISLTYQTVMRFYNRFGDIVSVINSKMSKGERYDSFEMAKSGKIRIMIGPRSALFTPFNRLSLIIIDEEHESAYKSENVPRYHARETAIELAKMTGAKVVLGSATPSLESYYNAKAGRFKLYELNNRAGLAGFPTAEIVDLREELRNGNRTMFSNRLMELMKEKLSMKEQVMLFLNRRGYLGFLSCRNCGHVITCPHCAVSLTEHGNGRLVCHYCGYETPGIKICPECGSKHIGRFKAGTELVESEIKKLFPDNKVLRMDADTTRNKDGHAKILEAFENHEADILIGTQMIVKGHDFPNVTLVGVLLADVSLYSPDYMAAERTFELITQAAGRAGRGNKEGNAVIQTYSPEHYSIVHACNHDYESFYNEEIAFRELMDYPPVYNFMTVRIASEDEQKTVELSEKIKQLTDKADSRTKIIGPGKAPVYKVKDVFFRQIYYKDKEHQRLQNIKKEIDNFMKEHSEYLSKCQIQYDFR